ncbi:hypothetical protein IFT48_00620 [Pseudomonas fluorescens]|uniref:hypothetical protein n=1 Tax=Pseudomonas fluorescens TaxID=294 RepID=UPI001930CB97|nr:hypothetical protein [Pseudomonas fluorescens]MBD8088494.1 hypothetical protein [Pseudomonas fluorescens]
MYSKFLATACLALLIVGHADAESLNGLPSGTPGSDVGEAVTVRQMLAIDATLGLHTEQQRFQERLKAAAAKFEGPVATSTDAIMTPIPEQPENLSGGLPDELVALTEPAPQTAPVASAPTVEGVFGMGRHLYADTMIDGSKYRFESGKALPLGASSDFPWRLKSITPPCVRLALESNPGQTIKSCISGGAVEDSK